MHMQDKPKAAKPSNLIKGATGDWEIVIGLEVHAQVNSQSKLFSGKLSARKSDCCLATSRFGAMIPA